MQTVCLLLTLGQRPREASAAVERCASLAAWKGTALQDPACALLPKPLLYVLLLVVIAIYQIRDRAWKGAGLQTALCPTPKSSITPAAHSNYRNFIFSHDCRVRSSLAMQPDSCDAALAQLVQQLSLGVRHEGQAAGASTQLQPFQGDDSAVQSPPGVNEASLLL